jgi:hypothetical protein
MDGSWHLSRFRLDTPRASDCDRNIVLWEQRYLHQRRGHFSHRQQRGSYVIGETCETYQARDNSGRAKILFQFRSVDPALLDRVDTWLCGAVQESHRRECRTAVLEIMDPTSTNGS